jgi:glutamate-5-semialdehyde dehydrogenase
MSDVEELARRSREAASKLATMTTEWKDRALLAMAEALEEKTALILEHNEKDLSAGREAGISTALVDRLTLSETRVMEMADGLREVVALRDPVGEIVDGWRLPNGLVVEKVRVPLGVIGIIYEARPNVTVDAAGLCLKSGNAVILRGSSSAINSNRILVRIISGAAEEAGLSKDSVQLVESTDRESARDLMRLHGLIDVLIPRGGAGLIRTVVENSTVPVIETGVGNCHIYVDEGADTAMAIDIVVNAKTQRPGVCNACETLLVHKGIAGEFLPKIYGPLAEKGVVLRGCQNARKILKDIDDATEEDWYAEYLDLILAVKVVEDIDEAIRHIGKYGSSHSEAIVTGDYTRGMRFVDEVDSAAVYVNASTRFTDGGQFGMGAEIGISTQKLHARGPMSLPELTTTKFVIFGTGQVRP